MNTLMCHTVRLCQHCNSSRSCGEIVHARHGTRPCFIVREVVYDNFRKYGIYSIWPDHTDLTPDEEREASQSYRKGPTKSPMHFFAHDYEHRNDMPLPTIPEEVIVPSESLDDFGSLSDPNPRSPVLRTSWVDIQQIMSSKRIREKVPEFYTPSQYRAAGLPEIQRKSWISKDTVEDELDNEVPMRLFSPRSYGVNATTCFPIGSPQTMPNRIPTEEMFRRIRRYQYLLGDDDLFDDSVKYRLVGGKLWRVPIPDRAYVEPVCLSWLHKLICNPIDGFCHYHLKDPVAVEPPVGDLLGLDDSTVWTDLYSLDPVYEPIGSEFCIASHGRGDTSFWTSTCRLV